MKLHAEEHRPSCLATQIRVVSPSRLQHLLPWSRDGRLQWIFECDLELLPVNVEKLLDLLFRPLLQPHAGSVSSLSFAGR